MREPSYTAPIYLSTYMKENGLKPLFLLTPTVASYFGENIIIIHLVTKMPDGTINHYDIWPLYSSSWEEIRSIPNHIKDVRVVFPIHHCQSTDEFGETFDMESWGQPRWVCYIDSKNKEVSHHGAKITYDDDREFFVSLGSFDLERSRDISYVFFDTETTGLPQKQEDEDNDELVMPRLIQLSWIITNIVGEVIASESHIIKPDGFIIPENCILIHGISNEKANMFGEDLGDVLDAFVKDVNRAGVIVGHNIDFDISVLESEIRRLGRNPSSFSGIEKICTMKLSTDFCKIEKGSSFHNSNYAYPSLSFLYHKLFGNWFSNAHDSLSDASATMKCYWELRKRGIIDL